MQTEIERKWVVPPDQTNIILQLLTDDVPNKNITQGYISEHVRIRIIDDKSVLTIKKRTSILSSDEFTYDIPLEEAAIILNDLTNITKKRYFIDDQFTADVFGGELDGLIIIEREFESEQQAALLELPPMLGQCTEVTGDPEWSNANIGNKIYLKGIGISERAILITGDQL